MKGLITLALVLATTGSFAGNGESLLDRLMHRKIHYPESLITKGIEARVRVQILVTSENTLEIVSIDSESEEMKAAIAKQINQLKCMLPKSMVGQQFEYVYKFEVQK